MPKRSWTLGKPPMLSAASKPSGQSRAHALLALVTTALSRAPRNPEIAYLTSVDVNSNHLPVPVPVVPEPFMVFPRMLMKSKFGRPWTETTSARH